MQEQIVREMKKAFFDLIDKNFNCENPDYIWITELYQEIKNKLLAFLPNKNGKVYKQLDSEFDVDLFKHMIENNIFDNDSMLKLVNNTFNWILKLEAPIRDKTTLEAQNRVLNTEPNKIISTYLKEVYNCIEEIEKDIMNL